MAERKAVFSIDKWTKEPAFERKTLSLKQHLLQSDSGIISEFKRKSPSKGWIFEHADVRSVTAGYSQAGASGISILTDE